MSDDTEVRDDTQHIEGPPPSVRAFVALLELRADGVPCSEIALIMTLAAHLAISHVQKSHKDVDLVRIIETAEREARAILRAIESGEVP